MRNVVQFKLLNNYGERVVFEFNAEINLEVMFENFKRFLLASGFVIDPHLSIELVDNEADDKYIQELQNKIDELDAALTAKELE